MMTSGSKNPSALIPANDASAAPKARCMNGGVTAPSRSK